MSSVFAPVLSTPQNQISVKQPVQGPDVVSAVAGVVEDVGTEVLRNQAVEEAQTEFNRIAEARKTGGNRHKLSLQAKTKLNELKTQAPAFARDFDNAFSSAFGTGGGSGAGSGGVFAATPVEKGVEQTQQDVAQLASALQVSFDEASKLHARRVRAEELAKIETADEVLAKGQRKRNSADVTVANMANINAVESDLMNTVSAIVKNNGSIDEEKMRLFKNQMTVQRRGMVNAVRRNAVSQDGTLLVDQIVIDEEVKRIDAMFSRIDTMFANNSTTQIATKVLSETTATDALTISRMFPLLQAMPETLQADWLKVYTANDQDSQFVSWIKARNPNLENLFEAPEQLQEATLSGMNKVFVPREGNEPISQQEVEAVVTTFNTPSLASTAIGFFKMAEEKPEAQGQIKKVVIQNPDMAMPFVNNVQLKAEVQKNPKQYEKVVGSVLDGLRSSFISQGVINTGNIPNGISVQTTEVSPTIGTGFGPKQVVVRGAGVTNEMARVARMTTLVFENNPAIKEQVAQELDLPPESPSEAITAAFLNKSKEDTTGGVKVVEDPRREPDVPNDFSKANQMMQKAFQIAQETKEEKGGFTEDDLSFMVGTGAITEDDAQQYRNRGLVIGNEGLKPQSQTTKPSNVKPEAVIELPSVVDNPAQTIAFEFSSDDVQSEVTPETRTAAEIRRDDQIKYNKAKGKVRAELGLSDTASNKDVLRAYKEQGYTKEQMLEVLGAMGSADNAVKLKVLEAIEEIYEE